MRLLVGLGEGRRNQRVAAVGVRVRILLLLLSLRLALEGERCSMGMDWFMVLGWFCLLLFGRERDMTCIHAG
jgi:hypothetical protein